MKKLSSSYLILIIILGSITITTVLADTVTITTYPYNIPSSSGTAISVASSGNVGIGTTSPQASLDVNGGIITRSQVPAISFQGDISGARWMQGLGNYRLSFYSDNPSSIGLGGSQSYNGETYLPKVEFDPNGNLYTAGSIGIGTSSPQQALDVTGNIRLTGNIVSPNDICIGSC
ncbi:MAG: hypothetical protein WCC52_09250 [Nitrosotalea sp.]